jgi:hypothetical protein
MNGKASSHAPLLEPVLVTATSGPEDKRAAMRDQYASHADGLPVTRNRPHANRCRCLDAAPESIAARELTRDVKPDGNRCYRTSARVSESSWRIAHSNLAGDKGKFLKHPGWDSPRHPSRGTNPPHHDPESAAGSGRTALGGGIYRVRWPDNERSPAGHASVEPPLDNPNRSNG